MRRGFKTDARDIGLRLRSELGLNQLQPLDPWALAGLLDVPVIELSDFLQDAPIAVEALAGQHKSAFSAMVAFVGQRRVIVHNDAHAKTRQRSNLAHELSHVVLMHQPHPARTGESFGYDLEQENEAAWLGGVLLAPDQACLHACRQGLTAGAAADHLKISASLMRWRMNASGAHVRVKRERLSRLRSA
jgi:Zn-dependent peptidase ImmA (M78 family)